MECSAFELAEAGMDRGMTTVGIKSFAKPHIPHSHRGLWSGRKRVSRGYATITIDFKITAYDKDGVIGEASHTRAVVNSKRFKSIAAKKLDG